MEQLGRGVCKPWTGGAGAEEGCLQALDRQEGGVCKRGAEGRGRGVSVTPFDDLQGLALLEEKERKERLRHHRKIYRKNMAAKAERNYQINYEMCSKIVLQIIDFATKMAHYRELTKG